MRTQRRRELAKAAGFKLKRRKNEYIIKSNLSVDVTTTFGDTQGERDDAVLYLIYIMRRWSKNKNLRNKGVV
ncbi:hypothetical protein KIOSHI_159 [Bacillus phage Kioshi]|nr:hypothetical protein KIOSHI_159 [Bacillus phage Kioshi]